MVICDKFYKNLNKIRIIEDNSSNSLWDEDDLCFSSKEQGKKKYRNLLQL